MSEQKDKKQRKVRKPRRRPTYKHHPFATSVTLYSPDGSPVPEDVLALAESYIGSLAIQHNLLTAVNRASS
jgi:hypothetical protein